MTKLLTVKEAAEFLNISADALRKTVRAKRITHTLTGPLGKTVRFRQEWLDEHVEQNTVAVREESPVPTRSRRKPKGKRSHRMNGETASQIVGRLMGGR